MKKKPTVIKSLSQDSADALYQVMRAHSIIQSVDLDALVSEIDKLPTHALMHVDVSGRTAQIRVSTVLYAIDMTRILKDSLLSCEEGCGNG